MYANNDIGKSYEQINHELLISDGLMGNDCNNDTNNKNIHAITYKYNI